MLKREETYIKSRQIRVTTYEKTRGMYRWNEAGLLCWLIRTYRRIFSTSFWLIGSVQSSKVSKNKSDFATQTRRSAVV